MRACGLRHLSDGAYAAGVQAQNTGWLAVFQPWKPAVLAMEVLFRKDDPRIDHH